MKRYLPENLIRLAGECPFPLYVVGGSVRDFLAGFPLRSPDWDICAAGREEDFIAAAEKCGLAVKSVYRNTGTVKLRDETGAEYEFTRFRSDKYVRGTHTPTEITFTDDMGVDARRRDFCANAVYYDIKAEQFCDPLGGIEDIKRKTLRTVMPARKVFGEDGLRLMRLARQSAELGFSPDEDAIKGAREHRALIRDIAPERIYKELDLILHADEKHGDREAVYRGLKILHRTGVLMEILPELALGDGMKQRSDFHDHDVLEHSLRCAKYASPRIRLAALLHDVGKPFCMLRDGKYHLHAEEGGRIAAEILTRLKAPKKLAEETVRLVALHMRDYDLNMKESKVRLEIVNCYPFLEDLFALRQADFTACKDDLSPAPSVVKWKAVIEQMKREGAPFTVKELKVNGNDLLGIGLAPERVGTVLHELLLYCALDGSRNEREGLLKRVRKMS
ncbi:MAG: HD domain-containing protein [Clostridia bacterium]|nr:HD domain-containing protein [Clostridia bacterium]